jgi:multiple sugar transport system permease protein
MTTANPTRARAAAAASGTVKYVSLVIGALAAIIPLSVLFIASFKTSSEFGQTGPFDLPANWFNFANYAEAFEKGGMIEGFVNTSVILAISLAGTIVIGSMAAYAIDRFRFRGNRLVVALFLVATLIPGVTSQVATFQIINGLGLYNSMAALILLFMGTDIISIYIFIQFMQSIPTSIDEAAMLDGANRWQQFWALTFPGIRRIIGLSFILAIAGSLSVFEVPFIMTGGANGTSTFVIQTLQTAFNFRQVGLASAMAIVLLLIVLVVTFVQRKLFPDEKVDLT